LAPVIRNHLHVTVSWKKKAQIFENTAVVNNQENNSMSGMLKNRIVDEHVLV
jgi:hypothetical protein